MRSLVILDSAWLSHFTGHSTSAKIDPYFNRSHHILVPTVVTYEVYRQLHRKLGPKEAILILAPMQESEVIPFDAELALLAAELSTQYRLGTADAAIYATAVRFETDLITLDNDFRGLPRCVVLDF